MQDNNSSGRIDGFYIAMCGHCSSPSYWHSQQMVYPLIVTPPFPNPDIPGDIKADFEEARQIANLSPKGAAALLRLVIQKLCVQVGSQVKTSTKTLEA
jgi:hypothetical protein